MPSLGPGPASYNPVTAVHAPSALLQSGHIGPTITATPGVGAYSPVVPHRHTQAFGMGHGAEAHPVFKGVAGPSPLSYHPHPVASHHGGSFGTGLGHGSSWMGATSTPGVGSYNTNVTRHVTTAGMGSSHVGASITATPGVGVYNPTVATHHAQSFGFGHGKEAHPVFKGVQGPSALSYHPHQVATHLHGAGFGGGHNDGWIGQHNTPGVGSYNTKVGHHVTVAGMGSSHVGPTMSIAPGVGTYSPTLQHHHTQAFGMGHGAEAHPVFKGREGPGPLSYHPHQVASHMSGYTGGHHDDTWIGLKSTPGVGTYAPSRSMTNIHAHVPVASLGSGHVGPTISAYPGVGTYDPRAQLHHSQAFGFGHGLARPAFQGTGVPGAGKYEVEVDRMDRHTYISDEPH